ncbi:uncharacterized protein LOC123566566 [Mercenaria mercenaria]|uniref:uncharacterized protein LOC123566566 n=1 Tax=Mercenaria mercenaria TaxID=6596 RepID=UPI00234EE828|nr:uncharacterized protein LOC123566566 [Mercenaria mercenaria]
MKFKYICGEIIVFVLTCVFLKRSNEQSINSTVRLVTYNTGLTPRVGQYNVRRDTVGTAIKNLKADVVCLQEVWFSKDIERILKTVGTAYQFSYSELHRKVSQLEPVPWTSAPCMSTEFLTSFLPCIETKCRHTKGSVDYLTCAREKCEMLQKLEQECITCLILSGVTEVAHSCVDNIRNRFNIPGVLLLSSRPLKHVRITRFVQNKKLFIPRAYISAEVEGVGTVACTHTSADLSYSYFEDLKYASWEEQNLDEARVLLQSQKHVHRAVIMGDLNGGPTVPEFRVSSDFDAAYNYITSRGYMSSYVVLPGVCTWCRYNPLSKASKNIVLDHILTKNLNVIGTRRVLDDFHEEKDFPLSDHFGIELVLQTT